MKDQAIGGDIMKWSVIYLSVTGECSKELCEMAKKHEGRLESSVLFADKREGYEYIFTHTPNAYAFLNELWKFKGKVELIKIDM